MPERKRFAGHPGLVLVEELKTRRMSPERLALAAGVPLSDIQDIIYGRGAISPEVAFRLGFFFGISARLWIAKNQA